MITLSKTDVDLIKKLHNENMESLLSVIDGEADLQVPKEITNKMASCIVARVIANQVHILNIINQNEKES